MRPSDSITLCFGSEGMASPSTPQGKLIASLMAALAEFERDLTRERIRSGMAAAKAKGQVFGRRPGQRPKSDRLAPKVRELGINKNTVGAIVARSLT